MAMNTEQSAPRLRHGIPVAAGTSRFTTRRSWRRANRSVAFLLLAACFFWIAPAAPGSAAPHVPAAPVPHEADGSLTPPVRPSSGFSSNPFSLNHRDPVDAPKPVISYKNGRPERAMPDAPAPAHNAPAGGAHADLNIAAEKKGIPDRLTPDRATFSGGEHTLSRMDEKKPPEVNMSYQLNENTGASVTLNPQDNASPLHRLAGQDEGLNGAGVYMNVEVQPNLQMKVGGEYCEIESRHSQREDTAKGAAVGLEWSF